MASTWLATVRDGRLSTPNDLAGHKVILTQSSRLNCRDFSITSAYYLCEYA